MLTRAKRRRVHRATLLTHWAQLGDHRMVDDDKDVWRLACVSREFHQRFQGLVARSFGNRVELNNFAALGAFVFAARTKQDAVRRAAFAEQRSTMKRSCRRLARMLARPGARRWHSRRSWYDKCVDGFFVKFQPLTIPAWIGWSNNNTFTWQLFGEVERLLHDSTKADFVWNYVVSCKLAFELLAVDPTSKFEELDDGLDMIDGIASAAECARLVAYVEANAARFHQFRDQGDLDFKYALTLAKQIHSLKLAAEAQST